MKLLMIIVSAAALAIHAAAVPATTNGVPREPRSPAVTRVYQTDTNSFFKNLRAMLKAEENQSDGKVLISYFKKNGIDVSSPFSFYYKPRTGSLLIRATEEDQKKIEKLVANVESHR